MAVYMYSVHYLIFVLCQSVNLLFYVTYKCLVKLKIKINSFWKYTWKERSEANSLIYQAKPTNRTGAESRRVVASWDIRSIIKMKK